MKTCMKLFAIFLIFVASPVFAHIGDSIRACTERYGSPSSSPLSNLFPESARGKVYYKGDYQIDVVFQGNSNISMDQCVALLFSRRDNVKISVSEIEGLLAANSANNGWEETAPSFWLRSDKVILAREIKGYLLIITAEYYKNIWNESKRLNDSRFDGL